MINLQKGQTIDLRKNENGTENNLSQLTIGLGWDIKKSGGLFSRNTTGEYDLDAVAVLLDKNGKITQSNDIIYYGNKTHSSGNLWSTGDNLTGDGDGDDEQLIVKLDKLDAKYEKVIFFTSIYNGHSKGQNFGCVENAFIRAVDADGKEIAKYSISGDNSLKDKCSFIFGEAYRKDNTWKFRALGDAKETDSLSKVCESYK
jgi:tellurium resistance protein TerD